MARRSFALGFLCAALLAVGGVIGSALTHPMPVDAGPKAEAKPAQPLRAAHVVMSELIRDSRKWQDRAKEMNQKRERAGAKLAAMQNIIAAGGKRVESATGDEKNRLTDEMTEARRKFEDAQKTFQQEIDRESATHLKELYAEISTAIGQMAAERQLDAVYAHPGHPQRVIDQAKDNPMQAMDLLLRPSAMHPLYLKDSVDMTADLVERLNAKYDREEK